MQDFIDELQELKADILSVLDQIEIARRSIRVGDADFELQEQLGRPYNSLQDLINQVGNLLIRIKKDADRLRSSLGGLTDSGGTGGEGPSREETQQELMKLLAVASRAQTLISQGRAQIKLLAATIQGQALAALQGASRIMKALSGHIRRISARLFSLILSLLTPKKWKISGGLSLTPFGLASGNLSVTFGSSALAGP